MLLSTRAYSQVHLQKKIDLVIDEVSIEFALHEISKAGGFNFSYNPDVIPVSEQVSFLGKDQSVQQILDDLFSSSVRYSEHGSYIILLPVEENSGQGKQSIKISGEAVDKRTGRRLTDVTIYEVENLQSTLTDQEGYYDLEFSHRSRYVNLSISKRNFQDTIIQVDRNDPRPLKVELRPINKLEVANYLVQDSIPFLQFWVNEEAQKHLQNIDWVEKRTFQMSLLPMLGSNKLLSGKVNNRFSINVIAGYSNGTNGVEIGGAFNLVRKEVEGVGMAGVGNVAGGGVQGVQVAGMFNISGGHVVGSQLSGLFNGAQSVSGLQSSGLLNIARYKTRGAQLSGLINYSKKTEGIQMTGLININKQEVEGAQISGLINVTGRLKGIQLGVINIVDSLESGMPIGLISFVRSGMHKFELSHSSLVPIEVAFKMGAYHFYNIFSMGYRPDFSYWKLGYGLGGKWNYTSKLIGNLEVQSHAFFAPDERENWIGGVNEVSLNTGWEFGGHFALLAGPAVFMSVEELGQIRLDELAGATLYDRTTSNSRVRVWMGYRVNVRF